MLRRRQFLACLGLGVASLALPVTSAFAAASRTSTAKGVLVNGRWDSELVLWIDLHGKRYRIVELDARGVWFTPSEDSNYQALQPHVQIIQGQQRGLICAKDRYYLTGRQSVA